MCISETSTNDKVQTVSVFTHFVGRYESLGAFWVLDSVIRERYDDDWPADSTPSTRMHWFHITSVPSGEGFKLYVTPRSSDSEYQARRINRKCFFSFRGCDGLCELLPDAARLLDERGTNFGGCTSAPRSWCESKNDNCREVLRK